MQSEQKRGEAKLDEETKKTAQGQTRLLWTQRQRHFKKGKWTHRTTTRKNEKTNKKKKENKHHQPKQTPT